MYSQSVDKKEYKIITNLVNCCFALLLLCSITNSDLYICLYLIIASAFLILVPLDTSLLTLIALTHFQKVIAFSINWNASFHIVLVVVFVLKALVQARLPKKNLIIYIIVAIYILSGARIYKVQDLILAIHLFILLVAVSVYKRDKWHKYIFFYIYGHLLATLLSFFAMRSPRMVQSFKFDYIEYNGVQFARFFGLDLDCIIFALNCLVILATLLVLHENDRKNKMYILAFFLYSVFGFLSISKMFMLVYAGMLFLYLLYNFKMRNKRLAIVFIVVPVLLIIIDFLSGHLLLTYIMSRFTDLTSMDSFTSHRSSILILYLNDLLSDGKKILFGVGMAHRDLAFSGPHNSYVEIIYNFGLIGSTLLITYFVSLYKFMLIKNGFIKVKCRLLLLCITAISCTALHIINYYFFVFVILVVFIILVGFKGKLVIDK